MESPSAPLDLILDNTLKGQIQGHWDFEGLQSNRQKVTEKK